MSWKMLYNGNCPPPGPEPFRFVYSFSALNNQLAIDNLGRIYTWGTAEQYYTGQTPVPIPATSNFSPHPAIVNGGAGSGLQLHYPYQVSNTAGWKNAKIYDSIFLAQDSENYLYAWGDGWWGQGGWDTTDHYDQIGVSSVRTYNPGGEYALLPTRVNNLKWLDYGTGSKHVIALGEDKRAYVWGTNSNAYVFGMPEYLDDQKTLIPVLVNTLPDIPLKIVSAADECNVVVTESNQIYAWGIFSWSPIALTPELVPLTIPPGVSIKQAIATNQGIVILLTNGEVYCRGYRMQFAPSPDWYASTLTKIPGNHFYTYISAFENAIGALDNVGNIWGWGVAKEFISRDDTFCNQAIYLPEEEPVFVASTTLGARRFTYFSVGNTSHCGIDTQGRLFCWGFDLWGQLGVNNLPADHSCSPLQVYNPTLANGTLAYDEIVAGSVAAPIHILQPLPQLSAHDPCGHWHKGSPGDEAGGSAFEPFEYAANCYEPAISTDGSTALLVLCGRHRKNEFYMVRYNIATGKWDELLTAKDVLCSNWDAGAANSGGVYAAHVFTYDITGDQYNEETSNPRMITYVVGKPAKEWPGTIETNGRNKVAVTSAGVIACIIRIAASWQIYVSANHGTSYALLGTLPGDPVIDIAVVISPVDNLVYVATINASPGTLSIYTGTNTGTGWALKSTTSIPAVDPSQRMSFRVDGTRFFVATGSKFYYSTNNCTSFIERDLRVPSQHFAATGTEFYNLADDLDYRTNNYEQSPIAWDSVAVNTPIDRCCISNAGRFVMFSQSTLRDDSPEAEVLVIMMSRNMGVNWQPLSTPIRYFESFGDAQNFGDSPIWPFVPQYAKL